MTIDQQNQVEKYRQQYSERCSMYMGYAKDCTFGVYYNPTNLEDKNITIISTFVNGTSNDFLPYFETIYLLVEPDGNVVSLMDVYNEGDVAEYAKKLKIL